MKVLVLDEEIPYPQNSGKRIRVHALLTRMAKWHDLTLLAYMGKQVEDAAVAHMRELGIRVVGVQPPRREQQGGLFYLKLFANLFSPLPYVSWNYCGRRMRHQLLHLLNRERFDLVHTEMTLLAPVLRGIVELPTIGVAHNVESEIWRRYVEVETRSLQRQYVALQRRRVERFEITALRRFSALCVVSNRDKAWFRKRSRVKQIHVVPNGVDLSYFRPCGVPEEPSTLVFVGAMDWRPNVDGVEYFLREIYPLILRRVPQARFVVVGRNPSESIFRLAAQYRTVDITGTVEDVRPYLERAAVFVVPLRVGGGSRLKILTALAMAKAVVSTPVGSEGLEVRDGQNVLIAESPEEFADRTTSLLKDPDHRWRLGTAGRALVQTLYGWDTIAERLEEAWQRTVSGGIKSV